MCWLITISVRNKGFNALFKHAFSVSKKLLVTRYTVNIWWHEVA
jgi:hypothetical protein